MCSENSRCLRANRFVTWLLRSRLWLVVAGILFTLGSLQADNVYDANDGVWVTGGTSMIGTMTINGQPFDATNLTMEFDDDDNFLGWALNYAGPAGITLNSAYYNSLTLDYELDIGGNLSLGGNLSASNVTVGNALLATYQSSGNESNTTLSGLNSTEVYWTWSENGSANLTTQMALDPYGNLTLADTSGSGNFVVLYPGNLSTSWFTHNDSGDPVLVQSSSLMAFDFALGASTSFSVGNGSIFFNGTNSSLSIGNVSITNNSTSGALILTDTETSNNISLNGDSYTFTNGLSWNGDSWEDLELQFGTTGVAIGQNAMTNHYGGLAIGNSTALGNFTIALGGGCATADQAIAIGGNSTASALTAVAIGEGTHAENWGAVALGHDISPISANSTTAWAAPDPAFIVGVGNISVPANGLVVFNNGNSTLGGAAFNHSLQVNGASVLDGNVTFGGNVTISQAQGDISMGSFH